MKGRHQGAGDNCGVTVEEGTMREIGQANEKYASAYNDAIGNEAGAKQDQRQREEKSRGKYDERIWKDPEVMMAPCSN